MPDKRGKHPNSRAHQWKPGESGNAEGRKTLGAYVKERMNSLAAAFEADELTVDDIQEMSLNHPNPNTRMAATKILNACRNPDLADFTEYLESGTTLSKLKESGVDTSQIKKAKVKTRTFMAGEEPVTEVEREIELHDRAGADFDRVMDQTAGKPVSRTELTGADGAPLFKSYVGVDIDKV